MIKDLEPRLKKNQSEKILISHNTLDKNEY